MVVAVWSSQKNHRRDSNCKSEKSIKLSLPVLTPSENSSTQTSKNLLDSLPSELKSWDYGLLQSSNYCFPFISIETPLIK